MPDQGRESNHGRHRVGAGIAIAGLALAGAGSYGIYSLNSHLPHLPDEVTAPDGTGLRAVQVDLVKDAQSCYALGAWDTTGSAVRTKVKIPGSEPYIGRKQLMEKGKAIDRTCIEADGITIADGVSDGRAVKVVSFERSAFEREVHMASYPDTVITNQDAPGNQALNGGIEAATGLARILCTAGSEATHKKSITVGGMTITCDTLNRVAEANKLSDAQLRGDLEASVEKQIQMAGGKASWSKTWQVFGDSYKEQAKQQGIDPSLIKLQVVDDGVPTSQSPDFDRDPYQELYDNGTLTPHEQELIVFDKVDIQPLEAKPRKVER